MVRIARYTVSHNFCRRECTISKPESRRLALSRPSYGVLVGASYRQMNSSGAGAATSIRQWLQLPAIATWRKVLRNLTSRTDQFGFYSPPGRRSFAATSWLGISVISPPTCRCGACQARSKHQRADNYVGKLYMHQAGPGPNRCGKAGAWASPTSYNWASDWSPSIERKAAESGLPRQESGLDEGETAYRCSPGAGKNLRCWRHPALGVAIHCCWWFQHT